MEVRQLENDTGKQLKICLNLDRQKYKSKPIGDEMGAVCNRTKKKANIVSIEPYTLIGAIQEGRTFTPGVMEGTKRDDWKSQQIIAADIDNKKPLLDKDGNKVKDETGHVKQVPCDHVITPDEALGIMKANNIDPFFMYYSFSNTEQLPRFRVVCVLPEPITDKEEAMSLTRKLAHLFNSSTNEPNADTAIATPERMLLGSYPNSVFYVSNQVTDKSDLDKLMDPEPPEDDFSKLLQVDSSEEDRQLRSDIENFDLESYILSTVPGAKIRKRGSIRYINPCPICGHNDDFAIDKNHFKCFGADTPDDCKGMVIEYLMFKEGLSTHEALDKFSHEIMGHPRTNGKKEAPSKQQAEVIDLSPTDFTNATKEMLFNVAYVESALDGYSPAGQEEIKEKMLDRARELNCLTAFKKFVAKVLSEMRHEAVTKKITGLTEFEHRSLKKPLFIGDNFISDEGKIYGVDREGMLFTICPTEVYPLERLSNIDTGKEKVTITFRKDSKWIDVTVDKYIIANHSKVVELSSYGLPITSIHSKAFVAYLAAVESLNKDIPVRETCSNFGWVEASDNSKHFVPYSDRIRFDGIEEYKDLSRSLKPHGSKEVWFNLAKEIRKDPTQIPQLFMSISLASVLLKPLNMQPFIANLWGLTGRGKTCVLKLATSIWSNPDDGKYIVDGDTTSTALFSKASVLKSLPLCIDDFSKVDLKRLSMESLIYTLCSGADRNRANIDGSLKLLKTWNGSIITTFERPMIDENMKGGAVNRVLDIEIPNKDIFEDPGRVFETIQNNYGFLGELFIKRVLEIPKDKLYEMRKDFEKKILEACEAAGEKKEMKQVIPLSVVLTADKIASELFEDHITLDAKKLIKHLKGINEVSDGQRAYDYLQDYISVNSRNFINLDNPALDENHTYSSSYEIHGYTGTENSQPFVFLSGLQLDIILNGSGYNKKVFLNWLREKELIKHHDQRFVTLKRILGKPIKVYAIKLPISSESDSDWEPVIPESVIWE